MAQFSKVYSIFSHQNVNLCIKQCQRIKVMWTQTHDHIQRNKPLRQFEVNILTVKTDTSYLTCETWCLVLIPLTEFQNSFHFNPEEVDYRNPCNNNKRRCEGTLSLGYKRLVGNAHFKSARWDVFQPTTLWEWRVKTSRERSANRAQRWRDEQISWSQESQVSLCLVSLRSCVHEILNN